MGSVSVRDGARQSHHALGAWSVLHSHTAAQPHIQV
jgi:hypothetical protein